MAKYRTSFVTNSSSSSFICDICDENHSGWDSCPSDIGGGSCVNGHSFCDCFRDFSVDQGRLKEDLVRQIKVDIVNFRTKSYWINDGGEGRAKKAEEDLRFLEVGEVDPNDLVSSYFDELPESKCPICSFQTYSNSDMCNYLYKLYGIDRGLVFAEIKKVNKRRRKLYDSEYIDYVCRDKGITTEEIMVDIRSKFSSYGKFIEGI